MMFTRCKRNIGIMLMFLWRDCYIFRQYYKRLAINNIILTPLYAALCFGYLIPYSSISGITPEMATVLFIGSILWTIFPFAFSMHVDLLVDLEHHRFIDYQLLMLNPYLIMLEKIFFVSSITCIYMMFFYPVAMMLLGSYFYAPALSWAKVAIMIYSASLFCSIFFLFFVLFVKSLLKVNSWWIRFNQPMVLFGGLIMPRYVMLQYSSLLGSAMLANPLIYVTEGLRQAIVSGPQFLPIWQCILALSLFSLLFMPLVMYYFKKRVDFV